MWPAWWQQGQALQQRSRSVEQWTESECASEIRAVTLAHNQGMTAQAAPPSHQQGVWANVLQHHVLCIRQRGVAARQHFRGDAWRYREAGSKPAAASRLLRFAADGPADGRASR